MTPRRVRVAGVGETGPSPEDRRSIPEMVLLAVEAALADAGLGPGDVDAAVTASVDLWDGLTASGVAVVEVTGTVMKPETRIAGDGLCAAAHASCQIQAGAYDTVLVVAHGKASMAAQEAIEPWALDPIHLQPLGLDFRVVAGLQASVLAARDKDAPARWASLAAGRLRDAGRPTTAREVMASPVIASPIRALMAAPPADAACAVVLRAGGGGPVLADAGWDLDAHAPGDRDLGAWQGLRRACARAGAGGAFDLYEPSCRFAHEEDLFFGALGGAGGAVVSPGGAGGAAVSPGGGLFAGAAPVAAGLSRLCAAARRMRADARVRRALVHGAWGPAGQGQVVAVLEAA